MPPTTAAPPERTETPCVSSEALLGQAMQRAITDADPAQVLRLLRTASSLPVAVAIRALWLPLAEELSVDGAALDADGRLGRLLREQIRAALLLGEGDGPLDAGIDEAATARAVPWSGHEASDRPPLPITHWLVPANPGDTTAAYLAALVLNRQGMSAGVWPWPLPSPGPSLVVGDAVAVADGSRQDAGAERPTPERIPIRDAIGSWPPLAALVA